MDIQKILAICGAIVLIANAGSAIYRWIRPALSVTHDVKLLKEHDQKDYEALQHLNQMNRAQCRAMMCIINHMIDGNGVDKMKETREQITDILGE